MRQSRFLIALREKRQKEELARVFLNADSDKSDEKMPPKRGRPPKRQVPVTEEMEQHEPDS